MRFPYSLGGMLLLPALVGVVFLFQITFFAKIVFLPLIAMYAIIGTTPAANDQEFLLIFLYWASIGFLIGLIFDLCSRQSRYSPSPRPPL